MEKIVLIGAGGHAKTIADTIERLRLYEIVGFVDRSVPEIAVYKDYMVVGCDDDLKAIYESGVKYAFIAIGFLGHSRLRQKIYENLKQIGFIIPTIIDSTAIVAGNVLIGDGTYVGRNVVINVSANIGCNCIINTSAVIEHECNVGDFSHVAVGTVVCGQVIIGENSFVGANATIIQSKEIGSDCIIGAGTVVRKNIPDKKMVVGDMIL